MLTTTIVPPTTKQVKPLKVKGHITRDGDTLVKRTVLMTKVQAFNFLKCQNANPNVLSESACVVRSGRAKGERKWFVEWVPKNPVRQAEMYTKFDTDRQRRAELEFADYEFHPLDDRPGWYWCIHHNPDISSVYAVHPITGCDVEGHGCADMFYRGQRVGKQCKHYHGLLTWLKQQEDILTDASLSPASVIRDAEARAALDAKVRANIGRDF